jgi:hypothetical protein
LVKLKPEAAFCIFFCGCTFASIPSTNQLTHSAHKRSTMEVLGCPVNMLFLPT